MPWAGIAMERGTGVRTNDEALGQAVADAQRRLNAAIKRALAGGRYAEHERAEVERARRAYQTLNAKWMATRVRPQMPGDVRQRIGEMFPTLEADWRASQSLSGAQSSKGA